MVLYLTSCSEFLYLTLCHEVIFQKERVMEVLVQKFGIHIDAFLQECPSILFSQEEIEETIEGCPKGGYLYLSSTPANCSLFPEKGLIS